MADAVHVEFRFKIGDEVTLRGMCSPFLAEHHGLPLRADGLPTRPLPQKMVVVGRIAEECIGGMQLHYKVRVYDVADRGWGRAAPSAAVVKDLFMFGEFELAPWADAAGAYTVELGGQRTGEGGD